MSDAFRERIALVTGAGSGIGSALVDALRARGTTVCATDVRAAAECEPLDVTDAAAVQAAVGALVSRHGRLDFVFANAGVALWGETRDLTVADWRPLVDVNLWGVVHVVQAAYPVLVAQGGGHLVLTASLAGLGPSPVMTAYATTKHAVVALGTSLRAEAASLGVRVTVVCPGVVDTPLFETSPVVGLTRGWVRRALPVRRMSAATCAATVLAGVERNRAVVVVGAKARLAALVARISPSLTLRLAARRMAAVRRDRASLTARSGGCEDRRP